MKVLCHDHTPYRNFRCPECGFVGHVHLSELPLGFREMEVRTVCKGCGEHLVLPTEGPFTGEEQGEEVRS